MLVMPEVLYASPGKHQFQALNPGEVLHPLDEFYRRSQLPLPAWEPLTGEEVPEPYRRLLVHENDMTSTLETFHTATIHVHVLSRTRAGQQYFREVILETEHATPVELGAIKIHLDRFAPAARKEILSE